MLQGGADIAGDEEKGGRRLFIQQDRQRVGVPVLEPVIESDAEIAPVDGIARRQHRHRVVEADEIAQPGDEIELAFEILPFVVEHVVIEGKPNPARRCRRRAAEGKRPQGGVPGKAARLCRQGLPGNEIPVSADRFQGQ